MDAACHHSNRFKTFFNHATFHFDCDGRDKSVCVCASAGFRQAEDSLVLSKQTVESSSSSLDGVVEMMSLLLLFLLLEAVLIIISAAPKPLRYQQRLLLPFKDCD